MTGERWATFDCYGTLIDWMGGIRATLEDLWPEHDAELLLAAYHEIEPEVQRGRAISYRRVLAESLERVAHREGLELSDERPRGTRRLDAHVAAVPRGAGRAGRAARNGGGSSGSCRTRTPTCSTRRSR